MTLDCSPSLVSPFAPDPAHAQLVIAAPGAGPGFWAGGPCAVVDKDGSIILAYRLRRPVGQGRGYANVVARSTDGIHFETISSLQKESFNAESLERPWIVRKPNGKWRIYISAATPGTKHWRVDAIDADDPSAFRAEDAVTVLPGNDEWGVKDPVIYWRDEQWHIWLCYHPLAHAEDADRMDTRYGTSNDGLDWNINGVALAGRPGEWDERGARIGDVQFGNGKLVAYYDGCACAEQDTEELLGIAVGESPRRFEAIGSEPAALSPHSTGSIRYLSFVTLPDGNQRVYYEMSRNDGAHEIRTELIPAPLAGH